LNMVPQIRSIAKGPYAVIHVQKEIDL
jgi:hypothetical protein